MKRLAPLWERGDMPRDSRRQPKGRDPCFSPMPRILHPARPV